MRYRNIVVPLLFAVVGSAAELTLGSGTVSASQSVILTVNLKSAGEALTGIQFDIEFDAAVFDVSLENGQAQEQAFKSLQSASLGEGKRRVLIIGLNQTSLSDGVVAILRVSLKGDAEARRSYTVRMTSPAGTDLRARWVAVSGHDGFITVTTGRNVK
jgi:hypothetical protein